MTFLEILDIVINFSIIENCNNFTQKRNQVNNMKSTRKKYYFSTLLSDVDK